MLNFFLPENWYEKFSEYKGLQIIPTFRILDLFRRILLTNNKTRNIKMSSSMIIKAKVDPSHHMRPYHAYVGSIDHATATPDT